MKLALISLNQVWENKEANCLRVIECLRTIADTSIDLVIFPEMTLTGFTMNTEIYAEYPKDSETIHFFADCALKYNLYIGFWVILKADKKATNNFIIASPKGEILADYAKIHPFSYAGEDKYYQRGNRLVSVEIQRVQVGLSICYDLHFPEMFHEPIN